MYQIPRVYSTADLNGFGECTAKLYGTSPASSGRAASVKWQEHGKQS